MKLSAKDLTLQLQEGAGFVSMGFLKEPAIFKKKRLIRPLK